MSYRAMYPRSYKTEDRYTDLEEDCSDLEIKQETTDDERPTKKATGNARNITVVKQEQGQLNHKRARSASRHEPGHGYSWDDDLRAFNIKAHRLGLVELPVSQVGRIMEGGDLTDIFHTDPVRTAKNFLIYDGLEILARVADYQMQCLVYDYAANFIGSRLNWSHPRDHDLVVSSIQMKGRLGDGYAVKISLPEAEAESSNKKQKGPSRKGTGRV
ncbi:hypothetical protein PGQ11_009075 [Apiospora arundinis]|uniref:Uncharacterized protein n=1 Tax=Apiospora arundinis TaxID=335852 RepID=A0ABR2IGZ0_9PEZI